MPGPSRRKKKTATRSPRKPKRVPRRPTRVPAQASDALYKQAIAAAEGVVYQLDFRTNTYTFMSDGIERLLGYPVEEVTPQIWSRIGQLDRTRGAMAGLSVQEASRQFRNGSLPVWTADYRVTTRNGQTNWVSDSSVLLRDAQGQAWGCLGILQDITARRLLEERLRQSEKMEAIGQLAGGIAHDFNNILAAIMGSADMICMAPHNPKVASWAEMISRAAARASDLTAKLLAFARKGKYRSVPVNLHAVIAEVVALLEHSLDKRVVVHQILSAHPPVTRGDSTQLQSALLNLAINARDAMPDGGVLEFSTRIEELDREAAALQFPELEPGRYVCVAVKDTGTGMGEEVRKHLFEPFFTTKKEGHGTGLGLAASYGAVRNHNGAMRVESDPGCGSTFLVYLPALDAAVESDLQAREDAVVHGTGTILLVDDEDVVRIVASGMLESLGYHVILCGSGMEAIDRFSHHAAGIDLVLLDMVMPGMGGRETFAALRKIDPGVRALLSSGYSLEGEAQAALDDGILGFIQKPYKLAGLSQKISACIKGHSN